MEVAQNKSQLIYDPLYAFVKLTPVEWEIIHSPFYQRLRWIKQLGFSFYLFPGAEHSRFGHSIGVMQNAHLILRSCGRAVSDEDLMDENNKTSAKMYHQSLRLGALMHDLGTFPFSHTTEAAYIKFGETTNNKGGRCLADDHENLGSFIIKNTDYEGGVTKILMKHGFDPQTVSDLVKGHGPSIIANQILHSEIDCDRMDYLLRDAYYTGLRYGSYDRDYLMYHFTSRKIGKHDILTIKHNALHCVEDFLNSRFAWYSQVIRSNRGAKYDALAEKLTFYFLEKGVVYKYSDLLDMIAHDPIGFHQFNDQYFMGLVHEQYKSGALDSDPKIKDIALTLLIEKGARTAQCPELRKRLLSQDDVQGNQKYFKKAEGKVKEIHEILEKKGECKDWYIADIPKKDIVFVKSYKSIIQSKENENVLLHRDPVKITYENGDVKLLAEVENSIISRLQNIKNFIPNVFLSQSAYELLLKEDVIEDVKVPI